MRWPRMPATVRRAERSPMRRRWRASSRRPCRRAGIGDVSVAASGRRLQFTATGPSADGDTLELRNVQSPIVRRNAGHSDDRQRSRRTAGSRRKPVDLLRTLGGRATRNPRHARPRHDRGGSRHGRRFPLGGSRTRISSPGSCGRPSPRPGWRAWTSPPLRTGSGSRRPSRAAAAWRSPASPSAPLGASRRHPRS